MQTQVAEKYMELYKVEEIPSYRYCVYRRRDPSVSQIDARTDRGTYIEKLEEVRQDPTKKLENIRSVMAGWKVKGRVRFVEWVPAPVLGTALDIPITGQKVETVLSSKFCTGRHLQLFNQTISLLEEIEQEEQEEREGGGGGAAKKRKVEKTSKPYHGKCKRLADYREDVRLLKKVSAIFPEILDISRVLFLLPDSQKDKNSLTEECRPDNQIRLIGTIIEAVTSLEKGNHLLVQGFPLHTRLTTTIFYCLAALFQEVGFVKPSQQEDFIFLSNFLGSSNTTAEDSIASLENILTVLISHKGAEQVVSVWPVQDLVQDNIYQEIILFNQTRIKEKIMYLTSHLETKPEQK